MQTVHTHFASVHQAAKLVAAPLRVVGVTTGLAESNGSLPPGLWFTSPAGWLPRTGINSGTLRWVIEYELPLPFYLTDFVDTAHIVCRAGSMKLLSIHPPVCLSHRSTAAVVSSGFSAECPAARRYQSTACAGAQQKRQHCAWLPMWAVSCWQPPDEAEHGLVKCQVLRLCFVMLTLVNKVLICHYSENVIDFCGFILALDNLIAVRSVLVHNVWFMYFV